MNVLCVVAHPDDELGCAGTLAQHAAAGDAVRVVALGSGVGARGETGDALAAARMRRWHEMQAAGKEMGGVEVGIWRPDWPDQRYDTLPLVNLIAAVETVLREHQPHVLYVHTTHDVNRDHRLTREACDVAARVGCQGTERLRGIYAFSVAGDDLGFSPQRYVRLTAEESSLAWRALGCYGSEHRDWPHPRSSQAMTRWRQYRGTRCGADYAEAFEVVREIVGAGMPGATR